MKEKDPLVSSVDYDRDGTTAKVSLPLDMHTLTYVHT